MSVGCCARYRIQSQMLPRWGKCLWALIIARFTNGVNLFVRDASDTSRCHPPLFLTFYNFVSPQSVKWQLNPGKKVSPKRSTAVSTNDTRPDLQHCPTCSRIAVKITAAVTVAHRWVISPLHPRKSFHVPDCRNYLRRYVNPRNQMPNTQLSCFLSLHCRLKRVHQRSLAFESTYRMCRKVFWWEWYVGKYEQLPTSSWENLGTLAAIAFGAPRLNAVDACCIGTAGRSRHFVYGFIRISTRKLRTISRDLNTILLRARSK